MMDHEGRIIGVNPAAERVFHISDEDARGREMAEVLIPPTMRDAHRHGLARLLAGGEPHVLDQRIEVTAQREDGTLVPVELTITRLDVDGPPIFVGYLRDIGDRIEAEEALRRSRMQLLRATDDARRRLERDLHDGAQQRLVGLALTLRMARGQIERNPNAAIALLPLDVTVTGVPEGRLPIDVESTAYFVVAEGLTNVVRYAGTNRAQVDFAMVDGRLAIEVRDFGRGGANPEGGTG